MEPTGPRPLSRRRFLAALAATGALAACSSDDGDDGAPGATVAGDPGRATTTTGPPLPTPDLPVAPFTLGVASGDPLDDRVILWTRLAPEPFAADGGMPDADVPVRWEVATDGGFGDVVAEGEAVATPALGHSVHVDATGLEPATTYWYRFIVGDHVSPVGRTRTLPASSSSPEAFTIGVANCQDYGSGYYAAYRHLVQEDLDVVAFLGDYIYERAGVDTPEEAIALRRNYGPEAVTLDQYRARYALYKLDTDLQAAHHAFPWIVLWDDHEVANNYAGPVGEKGEDPAEFDRRRAAAYQAWYEHLPVRVDPPDGPDLRIWRDFAVGDLAHLFAIDVRQSSDPIPCRATSTLDMGPGCAERDEPERSNLGDEQEAWLFDGLRASNARWNLLVNPVLMSGLDIAEQGEDPAYYLEVWDGFPEQRRRVVEVLDEEDVSNPVVISGDYHAAFVADLKADPWDPDAPVVAPELLGSSISSLVFSTDHTARNPQIRYFDPRNGYLVCRLSRDELVADFRYVADVGDPDSPLAPGATFVVTAGSPTAERR